MSNTSSEKRRAYKRAYYQLHRDKKIRKVRERKLQLIQWYNNYKSSCKCFFCGQSFPQCLDFHHLDPSTKTYTVGEMARNGCSIKKIQTEIDKCIVVCSNDHRRLHYEMKLINSKTFK